MNEEAHHFGERAASLQTIRSNPTKGKREVSLLERQCISGYQEDSFRRWQSGGKTTAVAAVPLELVCFVRVAFD